MEASGQPENNNPVQQPGNHEQAQQPPSDQPAVYPPQQYQPQQQQAGPAYNSGQYGQPQGGVPGGTFGAQHPPNQYQYPVPHTVLPKNPGLAALAGLVWAGAGQIYVGQTGLGIAIIIGMFIFWFVTVLLTFILVGFLLIPIGWVIHVLTAVLAYQEAQSFNAKHGIVS